MCVLSQESQRATAEFLRKRAIERRLQPRAPSADRSLKAGSDTSSANGYRGSLTRLVDDELSEIIDTSDYNENCRFVGDYTPTTAT